MYFRGSRFNQTCGTSEQVAIPTDAASIERGKHLATLLCSDCHGANLAGTDFFSDPGLGAMHAKNLTSGKGGVGASYTDADFVRALRHGIRPDGTSVFVMPSTDFRYAERSGFGSIIAYLKQVPPVDQNRGPKQFTFI
jgi:mono/diheme cytochrome c family protein